MEGKIKSNNNYQFICSRCKQQHTVRGNHIKEWFAKHHCPQDLTYYYKTYNQIGHKVSKLLFKARAEGLIDTPMFISSTGIKLKNVNKFSGVVLK